MSMKARVSLRRGTRREGPLPVATGSVSAPGLAQRVLAFESYVGFQHDWIGVLAGVVVALELLSARLRRRDQA